MAAKKGIRKRQQFLQSFGNSAGTAQTVPLFTDGFLKLLEITFTASVTIAGASAGTVIVEPPSPLAVFGASGQPLTLNFNPGTSIQSQTIIDPVAQWIDSMRILRRLPSLTALSSAANGTYTIGAHFVIDTAAAQSKPWEKLSLFNLRGRPGSTLKWTSPSAAQLYAALVNGGNGTMTINSLSVQVMQVDRIDVSYGMKYESAFKYITFPLVTQGFNNIDLAINPGQRLRALTMEIVDSTTPAPSSTLVDQGYLKIGPNQDHIFYTAGMQAHNADVYQIRTTDYPTGGLILDLDEDGQFDGLPTPGSAADRIFIFLNCPSTPNTGSYARLKVSLVTALNLINNPANAA